MAAQETESIVCLLRSSSNPEPYRTVFKEAGFRVRQVPLLRFRMVNKKALREVLEQPERYGGLILTSPRSIRALERQQDLLDERWKANPAYVVGPGTARAVEGLGLRPEGENTGNGRILARYIVERRRVKPLLFLCGNRRRDEVPGILNEAGVPYEELTVYETLLRSDVTVSEPELPQWLVFFSPSGVEALEGKLPALATCLQIAAIGPTTALALQEQNVDPDAIAAEPNPEALRDAIVQSERGDFGR